MTDVQMCICGAFFAGWGWWGEHSLKQRTCSLSKSLYLFSGRMCSSTQQRDAEKQGGRAARRLGLILPLSPPPRTGGVPGPSNPVRNAQGCVWMHFGCRKIHTGRASSRNICVCEEEQLLSLARDSLTVDLTVLSSFITWDESIIHF